MLLGLGLAACGGGGGGGGGGGDGTVLEPMYGIDTYVDEDGDGWALEDGDCDDTDGHIYPGAPELPGDGVDSNCDGFDDPVDDTGM